MLPNALHCNDVDNILTNPPYYLSKTTSSPHTYPNIGVTVTFSRYLCVDMCVLQNKYFVLIIQITTI